MELRNNLAKTAESKNIFNSIADSFIFQKVEEETKFSFLVLILTNKEKLVEEINVVCRDTTKRKIGI